MNEEIVTPAYITYRKKKSPFRLTIIILSLALIVSCGSILSFILYSTGFGIKSNNKVINYYAVSFGQFASIDDANSFANSMQLRGGAGVIFSSKNLVLCGLYKSMKDADKVVESNTDYPCEVIKIGIAKKYSSQLKIVDNLLSISIQYDKSHDSNETQLSLKQTLTTLTNLIQDETNKLIKEFYLHTSSLVSAIISSTSNYGYSIKYVALSCLIELKNMSES